MNEILNGLFCIPLYYSGKNFINFIFLFCLQWHFWLLNLYHCVTRCERTWRWWEWPSFSKTKIFFFKWLLLFFVYILLFWFREMVITNNKTTIFAYIWDRFRKIILIIKIFSKQILIFIFGIYLIVYERILFKWFYVSSFVSLNRIINVREKIILVPNCCEICISYILDFPFALFKNLTKLIQITLGLSQFQKGFFKKLTILTSKCFICFIKILSWPTCSFRFLFVLNLEIVIKQSSFALLLLFIFAGVFKVEKLFHSIVFATFTDMIRILA